MSHQRYLELQRAELTKLENELSQINTTTLGRHTLIARNEWMSKIADQRKVIAIVEAAMAA